MANRQSLLKRGIRFGSTIRRVVHKENRLLKQVDDGHPKLNIIVRLFSNTFVILSQLKSDVEGTLEAILEILNSYNCDEQCKLQLVDFGVGAPTDKDVELAKDTGGILFKLAI